jgi:hypothetical protein
LPRALVERHVVADLGGLADDDARAVVDEQRLADPRARVDLDTRRHPPHVGERMRDDRQARLFRGVRDAVNEQGLHAAVGQEDLRAAEPTRRGVAFLRGGQVLPQLTRHARQGAESEHG